MNGNISQSSCGDGNYLLFYSFSHFRIFVAKEKEIEFTWKGLGYLGWIYRINHVIYAIALCVNDEYMVGGKHI